MVNLLKTYLPCVVNLLKTYLPYVLLTILAVFSYKKISIQKDRISTLESNEKILTEGYSTYRTKNDQLVTEIGMLVSTKEELYRSDSTAKVNLKKMEVKVKNLQNYISLTLSSSQKATVPVIEKSSKDSIPPKLDIPKIQEFRYSDGWYKVKGVLVDDSVSLDIKCRHKVDIVNEMIYKGWWIFKKPKELRTKVLLTNSRDTIESMQSFKVVKNKLEKLLSE